MTTDLTPVLSTMGFVLVFILPILTMRSLAEERKNGTEVLLATSPTRLSDIVLGKYLAALSVYMVMIAITLLYPIILSIFGKPNMPMTLGGYIGIILLGATFLAVGIFTSSITENQIVAAVTGIISLLIMWLIDSIGSYVGGIAGQVFAWLSLLSRYEDFNQGILNLSTVVYYLSFIAVFLFLTVRVIEKRRWSQG